MKVRIYNDTGESSFKSIMSSGLQGLNVEKLKASPAIQQFPLTFVGGRRSILTLLEGDFGTTQFISSSGKGLYVSVIRKKFDGTEVVLKGVGASFVSFFTGKYNAANRRGIDSFIERGLKTYTVVTLSERRDDGSLHVAQTNCFGAHIADVVSRLLLNDPEVETESLPGARSTNPSGAPARGYASRSAFRSPRN
jgi:hypothetical protein